MGGRVGGGWFGDFEREREPPIFFFVVPFSTQVPIFYTIVKLVNIKFCCVWQKILGCDSFVEILPLFRGNKIEDTPTNM